MNSSMQYRHIDNMILLRSCPLFEGLAPSELQRLVLLIREHRYGFRETVIDRSNEMASLYIVKQGSCSYGEQIFEEGESILEPALFTTNYTLNYPLIAESELLLISISKESIYTLLENNPSTSVRLVEWFAAQVLKR